MTTPKTTRENDYVIMFLNSRTMRRVKLERGKFFNCKYGNFRHDDIIGRPYGSKILAFSKDGFAEKCNKRWTVVLEFSPLIWQKVLDFRTQILYPKDIGYILMSLDVKIGSFVVEAGTGSGALTQFLGRAVAPTGHIFTFDIDAKRISEAIRDFEESKILPFITALKRDICEEGFPPLDRMHFDYNNKRLQNETIACDEESIVKLENFAIDSVFLDVPTPWTAVRHVLKILKTNGMFCSFSPCIEQVQKTHMAMEKAGFCEVSTVDLVNIRFSSGKERMTRIFEDEVIHTGYLTLCRKP